MNDKISTIVEKLKDLTLLEIVDLIKQLEETFDIDSKSMMAVMPMTSGMSSVPAVAPLEILEEKTSFDVVLSEVPADKKIAILKVVRNLTGLGLKESKDIVDNVPKTLKESVSKQESENIKKELEGAGAKVLLK